MTRKAMWDFMDKAEGKSVGSSFKNLQKERVRQGYRPEKTKTMAPKSKALRK